MAGLLGAATTLSRRLLRFFAFRLLAPGARLWLPALSQRRKPPQKALVLSPLRQPLGSSFSFFTLPPPRTTSSGSRAAIRRSTTSVTWRRHFFFPRFSKLRSPT